MQIKGGSGGLRKKERVGVFEGSVCVDGVGDTPVHTVNLAITLTVILIY